MILLLPCYFLSNCSRVYIVKIVDIKVKVGLVIQLKYHLSIFFLMMRKQKKPISQDWLWNSRIKNGGIKVEISEYSKCCSWTELKSNQTEHSTSEQPNQTNYNLSEMNRLVTLFSNNDIKFDLVHLIDTNRTWYR